MRCVFPCFGVLLLLLSITPAAQCETPQTVRVMTFNLWHGGEAGGQPLEQSIRVIQAARADIVGFQETGGHERQGARPNNGQAIADKLRWHYFDQGDGMGVASRFPIVEHTPRRWGVRIALSDDRLVYVFNAHFAHAPYQPYQLLKIPYEEAPFIDSADEAASEAERARGRQVESMLAEIATVDSVNSTVFVTGDFNEPSALDWTEAARRSKRCPVAVRWPTTSKVLEAGFSDAYRTKHTDPVESPGYTWTPITAEDDPKDRHDRIDFVFVRGRNAQVKSAEIIGERAERADVVVRPYPSDHRAVVAEVILD